MSQSPQMPDYRWVPGTPDKNGSTNGCNGCAFRRMPDIKCSQIPCQRYPGLVVQLIK